MFKTNPFILLFFFTGNMLLAQVDFSETHRIDGDLLSQMDSLIKEGKYEDITSILVAQDGNLLYEQYYNENGQNSLHNTRSATKTMATLLTGIAIDKGHIKSENDKIFDYLQHKMPVQNPDSRKEKITIEDLLTMSCILETDDSNFFSRGHEERMYFIEDWTQFLLDLPIRAYPFNPKPAEQPYGRFFSYSSAQASAVSEILQSAIGSKLDTFAIQNLFEPLGIKNFKLDYTPMGILNTAGGSGYRSRDFLKLIQLCLQKGSWDGKQIISSSWIEKATTPKASARENVEYGYFLWLQSFGKDQLFKSYYMSGNGGNRMLAFPELNVTVAITATNYNNRKAHDYIDEILNEYIIPTIQQGN